MANALRTKILGLKKKAILYTIIEWVCILTPFVVLLIAKKDEYFKTKNDTISLTLGCAIALFMVGLIICKKTKLLHTIGWYIIITIMAYCFKSVASDIATITMCGLCGYLVSMVFGYLANKYNDLYVKYKSAVINKEVMQSSDSVELDVNGSVK